MPLRTHPSGNYVFLPGIDPYSCGVAAAAGHEIVHVTLDSPLPYRTGFERIAGFLKDQNRPLAALCGMELRSPRPFTFPGFVQFNQEYAQILRDWGVFVDGINPVARTNVAPELSPPSEPVVYGFSYTRPAEAGARPTFVIAGAGELPEGKLDRDNIVCLADVSPEGFRQKADFVIGLMERRMAGLEVSAESVTAIDVYTVHGLDALLTDPLLKRLTAGQRAGIHWHFTRPPILDIEFEMDLRSVRMELRI